MRTVQVTLLNQATRLLGALAAIGVCCGASTAAAAPKVYFAVQGVQEPDGTKPSMKEEAKQVLLKELAKHDVVLISLGTPEPTGKALEEALEKRKLTGYKVILRLTKVAHTVNPPEKGKVYRVLMADVNVAVDAEKIPSGQMALAGEGSTQVGTEITKFSEKERIQLLREALGTATKQAVERSVSKLTAPPSPVKQTPRRKRARKAH